MEHELSLKEIKKEYRGTYKSYLIGFIASLFLTLLSFLLVIAEILSGKTLVYTIIALALIQAIVQLRFFLHLGHEDSPQWATLTFYFMLLVLLIIVLGSLWIMHDLDDRVMRGM